MKRIFIFIGIIWLMVSCSQKKSEQLTGIQPGVSKMDWWQEARLGLFIDWSPLTNWNEGKNLCLSEKDSLLATIPDREFEAKTGLFNPTGFEALSWIKLAKQAGMKYIIITAKDADGFAMYQSLAGHNIAEETLQKRDPLKELADTCKKEGIKLGIFYSHSRDWQGIERKLNDSGNVASREKIVSDYVETKAVPQIKELLANYNDISILWWEAPTLGNPNFEKKIKAVTDLYPVLITNNKLSENEPGDYISFENVMPAETPEKSWEYRTSLYQPDATGAGQNGWKPAECLIKTLAEVAGKGGNFLLCIQPTSMGAVPDSATVRLKLLGQWLANNGISVYGTTAGPFLKLPWGYCTQRTDNNKTTLYFHVFDWPKDQILRVPGFKSIIRDVYLVTNPKQKFAYRFKKGDLEIHTPNVTFDPVNTVIAVETSGRLRIK